MNNGSQNLDTLDRQIEEKYWYGVLHNNPQISTFPLDYPRDPKLHDLEGIIRCQLPPEVSGKIITVGNNSEPEIFVILLASVIFTISQYNDCEDVLVGILPCHSKISGLVCSNILPLKCRLDLTQNFQGFFASLKNIFLDAEAHKNILFSKIQELLGISTLDYIIHPLVNTVVLYKNIHNTEYLAHVDTDNTFSFERDGDRIELELQYNQNFYCHTKMEQVVRHCIQFLSMALFNPDIQLAAIDLEEKKAIGNSLNETGNNIDKPILSESEYIAPQNEIEQKLVAIWQEILGIEKISTHDNFFHLGGDSLLASKFEVLANQRGLNVTSQDLCYIKFLKPLARHIANQLTNASPDQNEKKPAIAKTQETTKLLDLYHRQKTFYPEYQNFCLLNCVRQILEYYGVEIAPLYVNAALSFAVILRKNKKFNYKLEIQPPGTPPVLPSHSKYVRMFAAPPRDVHKVWEINKKKIDQGVPLLIGLDIFYLDYVPLFLSQRLHSSHIAILCGYSNDDEKKAYISDWYDPWYFNGTVGLDQFLKARSSDNPENDLSPFCGFQIGNYWGEVTPNIWNGKPEELLFETLTLSLKQYVERIVPENNVFYGADAWKKLFDIIEENKENLIGFTDKDPTQTDTTSTNFLENLWLNLTLFRDRLEFFNLYLELAAQKVNLTRMPCLLDELHQQINRWEIFLPYVLKCGHLDSAEYLESFPTVIAKFKDLLSLEDKYLEKVALLKNELS